MLNISLAILVMIAVSAIIVTILPDRFFNYLNEKEIL